MLSLSLFPALEKNTVKKKEKNTVLSHLHTSLYLNSLFSQLHEELGCVHWGGCVCVCMHACTCSVMSQSL